MYTYIEKQTLKRENPEKAGAYTRWLSARWRCICSGVYFARSKREIKERSSFAPAFEEASSRCPTR